MSTKTIQLKLDGETLKWKSEQTDWQDVTPDSPDTGLNGGDDISWVADSSIKKIKISPKQSKILKQVNGDDTSNPVGVANTDIGSPVSEKYTIRVKPDGGGGYLDFDPKIHYPAD
ncbi:hypothetical protein [Marinoscillum furvescens]|uniref:Uncharacterized protein n=1 Tax=Marinoscillum furvescens DSM 4134 TaxID=1122208 RepID=A0A3D9KWY5_MARFU|nr:hypothetical protein [Marinoscillum furvescens]RED91900.1 hypothetical protein C7460_13515 [Marinoscillum furvescens DSM 4134]